MKTANFIINKTGKLLLKKIYLVRQLKYKIPTFQNVSSEPRCVLRQSSNFSRFPEPCLVLPTTAPRRESPGKK